jgi:hypothetical protein
MENTSRIAGVFQLAKNAGRKHLVWMGSLEECDLCHTEYPMSWIIFSGKQFLCYACHYPNYRLDSELRQKYERLHE